MKKKTKKKKKKVPNHIYDPIYRVNIYVCYGWSKKAFNLALVNYGIAGCSTLRQGKTIQIHSGDVWVWVETRNVPQLTHEAVHVAEFILLDKGLEFCNESAEAFAYYVEMVVRETLKK